MGCDMEVYVPIYITSAQTQDGKQCQSGHKLTITSHSALCDHMYCTCYYVTTTYLCEECNKDKLCHRCNKEERISYETPICKECWNHGTFEHDGRKFNNGLLIQCWGCVGEFARKWENTADFCSVCINKNREENQRLYNEQMEENRRLEKEKIEETKRLEKESIGEIWRVESERTQIWLKRNPQPNDGGKYTLVRRQWRLVEYPNICKYCNTNFSSMRKESICDSCIYAGKNAYVKYINGIRKIYHKANTKHSWVQKDISMIPNDYVCECGCNTK